MKRLIFELLTTVVVCVILCGLIFWATTDCRSVYFRSPITYENELDVLNRLHRETMRSVYERQCPKPKPCRCWKDGDRDL